MSSALRTRPARFRQLLAGLSLATMLVGCEWNTGEGWYACSEDGRLPVCARSVREARIDCSSVCPTVGCFPHFAEPFDCDMDGVIKNSQIGPGPDASEGRDLTDASRRP
jgi:hypothetical protein